MNNKLELFFNVVAFICVMLCGVTAESPVTCVIFCAAAGAATIMGKVASRIGAW